MKTIINLLMAVKRSCQWAEGTTRGDPIAVAFFVLSTQPMITCLQVASTAKQSCFPNDTKWWDRSYYGNEIVRHAECSGFRFWFLPKQREGMNCRKAKQDGKCEGSI